MPADGDRLAAAAGRGGGSTLRFLAVEPAMARLLGAEAPSSVPAISEARGEVVKRLAELLANGRELRPKGAAELPAGTERHLVAGRWRSSPSGSAPERPNAYRSSPRS